MPPRQLARAIAYSLTYSEPDEGLRKAVAEGKLSTREDVRREVERLVYATTPYGQEVSLTADQRARLDALHREHWQIKTPEARKAAHYNQKLTKAIGAKPGVGSNFREPAIAARMASMSTSRRSCGRG